jgi:hypothetical protein
MKTIGKVLLSPITAVAGLLKKPKDPPKPLPTISRDDVISGIAKDDMLRRRRGGAADMLTGANGAEVAAPSSAKDLLGE